MSLGAFRRGVESRDPIESLPKSPSRNVLEMERISYSPPSGPDKAMGHPRCPTVVFSDIMRVGVLFRILVPPLLQHGAHECI